MSILQSLFGLGRSSRQKDALIDLLLMTAHADGEVTRVDLDRLARAIEQHPELSGVDWDDVLGREEVVREDGPLFSETRARVARELGDPTLRRFGLTLAAQCASTPLTVEERALLVTMADAFAIAESEREAILSPWTHADPQRSGYLRPAYSDPRARDRPTWAEALARAETDEELAILLWKGTATRTVMARLSEDTELLSMGEVLEARGTSLRVDALLRAGDTTWMTRFLARGEAMFPEEHDLWPDVLERMESSVSLYIGYAERLPPPDQAALRRLNPARLVIEKV